MANRLLGGGSLGAAPGVAAFLGMAEEFLDGGGIPGVQGMLEFSKIIDENAENAR